MSAIRKGDRPSARSAIQAAPVSARSAETRSSVRPPRRRDRGRRPRAGRREGRSTFRASSLTGWQSCPSTSTSSISPAGSSSSGDLAPEARGEPAAQEPASVLGPATRIVVASATAGQRSATPARHRSVRAQEMSETTMRSKSPGRSPRSRSASGHSRESTTRRSATPTSCSSSTAPKGSGPRQRRKTGRSETSSGMTTLAGAAARAPQRRSEITSEQTSRCWPPRTKQRKSTSPSSTSRIVRPREEQDRARRVALGEAGERPGRLLDPALRHPGDVRHHRGAHARRRARLGRGVPQLRQLALELPQRGGAH